MARRYDAKNSIPVLVNDESSRRRGSLGRLTFEGAETGSTSMKVTYSDGRTQYFPQGSKNIELYIGLINDGTHEEVSADEHHGVGPESLARDYINARKNWHNKQKVIERFRDEYETLFGKKFPRRLLPEA